MKEKEFFKIIDELSWSQINWKIKFYSFLKKYPNIKLFIKKIFKVRCLLGWHRLYKRLWEFPEDKSWLIDIHQCKDCKFEKEVVLRRPAANRSKRREWKSNFNHSQRC